LRIWLPPPTRGGVDPPEGHEDDLKSAKADLAKAEKKKSNAIKGFFTVWSIVIMT
jgi:hypothetical protein